MARKGKQKKNNDSLPSVTETLRDFARRLAPLVASGLITAVTARKLIQSHPTAEMGTQTISGSGKYTIRDAVRDATSGAGAAAGGLLGAAAGPFGAGIGTSVGAGLGRQLGGLIVGHGDYTVTKNSISNQGFIVPEGTQIPSFKLGDNATRVHHREYCFDLVAPASPAGFSNNAYTITPSNQTLFPWLANLASNYQQYKLNGMVFEFRSTSSDITAGGALGAVIFASDYNVIDVNFTSKVAMENSQYATSCKPSLSMMHAIECDPKLRPTEYLFTRAVATTTSTFDPRFYDFAKLQIATQGLPSAPGTVLGEVWVTYDITLAKPILGINLISSLFGSTFPTGGLAPAAPFGTSRTVTNLPNYNITSNAISSTRAGTAMVVFTAQGSGITSATFTGIGGGTAGGLQQAAPFGSLTTQVFYVTLTFLAPGDGVQFNLAWTTMTSSFTNIITLA